MRDILRRLLGWKSAEVAPAATDTFIGSVQGVGRVGAVDGVGRVGTVRTPGDIEPV